MSGSTRRRLKSEISRGNFDDADEGTAARTRPLSYDEIMLKRKSKKELGVERPRDQAAEHKSTRHERTVTTSSHHSRARDTGTDVKINSRDHAREDTSKRKDDKISRMEDTRGKCPNMENRDVEGRVKYRSEKDLRISSDIQKNDSRSHGRSRLDEHSRDDTRYDNEKKRYRDPVHWDNVMERGRGAPEKENKRKDRTGEDEKHRSKYPVKRHEKDRSGEDEKHRAKDPVKRHEKDRSGEDEKHRARDPAKRHEKDRSGEDEKHRAGNPVKKHEKDRSGEDEKHRAGDPVKKHEKDRNGEDEKLRVRDPVKKPDSVNRRVSEISERKDKTELSRSDHDEKRSKRRRSRSQDHVKDKGRRSRSLSPKTHKNVSSHGQDHGLHSSHSQRDKSGRHIDIDQNKVSINGSTSHHRRHGGSSSGLGGYSPRKRKTEAAVKTPSPIHSPEKKSSAGRGFPSSGADTKPSVSVASVPQTFSQTKSSNMTELAAGISFASAMEKPLSAILPNNLSAFNVTSVDSIQLTQATRPMRRLYIDNIPGSVSEIDIRECFNEFLVSSGTNRILGRRPCISCMIHQEKGQALVEFLTPEDASAALSFDGRSLFGSVVKIRRPKDFVEVTSMPVYSNENKNYITTTRQSGPSERTKHGDDAISNIVKDSPYKIFIGGIAEGVSSDMIMAIVTAFGPLKAYHLEINPELNEQYAFIEYADQAITQKACAGLNGMKLGGRVLTVAQAVPDTSSLGNSGKVPFYGIPEHVKPLLELPTQVLKLSNVLDQHAMQSLSETDLEEIVEDVRLECSRFGSVVSINVIRTAIADRKEVSGDMKLLEGTACQEHHAIVESMGVDGGDTNEVNPSSNMEKDAGDNVEEGEKHGFDHETNSNINVDDAGRSIIEDIQEADRNVPEKNVDEATTTNEPQELDKESVVDVQRADGSDVNHQVVSINEKDAKPELDADKYINTDKSHDNKTPNAEDVGKTSDSLENSAVTKMKGTENGDKDENDCDEQDLFEVGCVLVEFKRTEASWIAAHCLHGRAFDDRFVMVQYVPLETYRSRFPK